MRIRIVGAGFYGCHLACALLDAGHDVTVFDAADRIFAGASGNCPARLHLGATHYPRSGATQNACSRHQTEFLNTYGFMTSHVPINIYAIASRDSLVDVEAYKRVLTGQVEYISIYDPKEYGLQNVDGAVLTGERHVVISRAVEFFSKKLKGRIRLGERVFEMSSHRWDITVDCTFCAHDNVNVDRYEPCLTVMLKGRTDRSVTVMDGPFCGIYVWDEHKELSSLTSASLTPLAKCQTWAEAKSVIDGKTKTELRERAEEMMNQMAFFMPSVHDEYSIADYSLAIRAMPRSGADTRLVDVQRRGENVYRIRAGKIDAIFEAEKIIKSIMPSSGAEFL